MTIAKPVNKAETPLERHREDILQDRFHSHFALSYHFEQAHLHLLHSCFRVIEVFNEAIISHLRIHLF